MTSTVAATAAALDTTTTTLPTTTTSAPTTTTAAVEELTAEDLLGSWNVTLGNGDRAVAKYTDGGTYTLSAITAGGREATFDLGAFSVTADRITFVSSAGARGCSGGDIGVYSLEAKADGALVLDLVDDACAIRSDGGPFIHTR